MARVNPVAVLGDVLLDVVESDVPTHAYDVTEKAVEDRANISDHMKERPPLLSISGVIVGPDAWTRFMRIRQYQQNRELVTYANRVIYSNMAIANINTEHDAKHGNGMKFYIELKQLRRAAPQQVQITDVPPAVATGASWMRNGGTQQAQDTDKQADNKESDERLATISAGYYGGGRGGGRGSGEIGVAIRG